MKEVIWIDDANFNLFSTSLSMLLTIASSFSSYVECVVVYDVIFQVNSPT